MARGSPAYLSSSLGIPSYGDGEIPFLSCLSMCENLLCREESGMCGVCRFRLVIICFASCMRFSRGETGGSLVKVAMACSCH